MNKTLRRAYVTASTFSFLPPAPLSHYANFLPIARREFPFYVSVRERVIRSPLGFTAGDFLKS